MKNFFLLFAGISLTLGISAQTTTEFITDGGFESTTVDPTIQSASWAAKGVWYTRFGSWKNATFETITDADKGKVVKANYTASNNDKDNGPMLYQRLVNEPSAGKATVGFWAKSPVTGGKVNVSLRLWQYGTYSFRVRQAFKLDDFHYPEVDADKNRSGAVKTFDLTDTWTYYTTDVDLTKIVNELAEPSWVLQNNRPFNILDATDADRKEMYIAFQGVTTVGDIFIDGVTVLAAPKVAASVKSQNKPTLNIVVTGKDILLSNLSEDVSLFNLTGRLLGRKNISVQGTAIFTELSKGVYIVKSGIISQKVVIY